MSARDPYLDVPLSGVQLIEASAGTGKTFTLATLVTRLVVEQGLRIGQILAVTYTEAATQELRKRIRERLQLALDVFATVPTEGEDSEATLTRRILDDHLARQTEKPSGEAESADALHQRLRQAVLETDLAAIFTIHGFCARVLREHALESGHGFAATELLTNERDLHAELAADLWRQRAQDADSADDLLALWTRHETLGEDLDALLSPVALLPTVQDVGDIAALQAQVVRAAEALRRAWKEHGADFHAALSAAIDAGVMNKTSYKPAWLAELGEWIATFAADDARDGQTHPKLEKLTVEALEAGTRKDHKGKTPSSPMTHEIAGYLLAITTLDATVEQRRANLLHRLRDDARQHSALLKRQRRVQTYDDLIDGVADALTGSHGEALARSLRGQYRVALVDEFQDTDARQWRIFDRVFGTGSTGRVESGPALFLIGDPKQAIYGFRGGDVHTYLAAADAVGTVRAPELRRNFRSRPSLLNAIAALYAHSDNPFGNPGIEFIDVEAGGSRSDESYRRNGGPAPALTVWQAPATGETNAKGTPTAWPAGESRELAARACVAAIHAVLADARDDKAQIEGEPVRPGDIAVLVRTHAEASLIQQALAQLGIPAVAAGKQSLFATHEAGELHALLLALLHTGDDGRLRTALCTVLVGADAATIDALDGDGDAQRRWQQQAVDWRALLERAGPLALVDAMCAQNAPRLLGLLDGERRFSNYLQLAELLQEAQTGVLGLHGLLDWLAHAIATADKYDETQLLRLESDARRVQIITLHKSKGLEYPLVFLPFVGVGEQDKSPGRYCELHDGAQRRLHWKLALPGVDWDGLKAAWRKEQSAEAARLLYVGMTRAEQSLWIASGPFYNHDKTALARLLGDAETRTGTLAKARVVFDASAPAAELPRLPPESEADVPPARRSAGVIHGDWWVYSFSQLSRSDAGADTDTASIAMAPTRGGNDEAEHAAASTDDGYDQDYDPRFAGSRFGVALHAAFEHADFAAWRGWRAGEAAPAGQTAVIADALRGEGYAAGEMEDGITLCTRLVGHTLTALLPETVRLCDVDANERRPEIEFQFALQATRAGRLLDLLHAHGIVRERDRFGLRQQLAGLMTGLIDLTYRHAGKWYVLDYKSNRLPGYDAAHLQRAMAHGEYDLQALIYTLAVHRWLRFRLGDGYDYARDFGGIRYVFCRGIDAARADAAGIHAQRFAPELVHALDALFGHVEGIAA